MSRIATTLLLIFVWGMMAAACTPAQPASEPAEEVTEVTVPTLPPPTETLAPTDTPEPTPTNTPEPTDTPVPTNTPTPDYTATAVAEEAAFMAAKEIEIKATLETLGLDPEVGHLAWVSEQPLWLNLANYSTHNWETLGNEEVFSDFVLQTDVTWESTGGLAICGVWLRAESYEEASAHYEFLTIRLSGLPLWDLEYWKYEQLQAVLSPGGVSNKSVYIDQEQGATNTYIFVAQGNLLQAYANGHRLGQMTISSLDKGLLAAYILQESGETTCVFDNAWVWDLAE